MILVDTSVVIDYLRSGDPKLLQAFIANDAAVCGIVRAEIFHGARDPAHRQRLAGALDAFQQIAFPEYAWDLLGDNLASLRAAGVTVPLADAIIATVAIHSGVALWTRDSQFLSIQRIIPSLKLFPEPA
jgi:predicted nucleic acid-binding protein